MLASTKRFLKNPNTVLIEEASIVLSENALAAPEVLNGVLKNTAKDAELLAELGNAEKSIGEGVAKILNDPELASKLGQGIVEEVSVVWGHWCDLEKIMIDGKEYAKINGRLFTRHAIERMAPISYGESWLMRLKGRGVPTSIVENVIKNGVITETRINNGVTRICKTIDRVNVVLESDIVISVLIKS